MNEKLTTVGRPTIMSSESYNCIIHVLLSAILPLFFAYRLRRIFCRCNNANDNGNATMAIVHIIRTARGRATGVRLAVRLPPAQHLCTMMAGDHMRDNMCGTWVWFFSLSPIHASHGLGLWRLNYSSTLHM